MTLPGKPATVTSGSQDIYDDATRKTYQVALAGDIEVEIHSRILALQPELESHFHLTLQGCRPPILLKYSVGDYFRLHTDTTKDPELPEGIKKRQVSISIMLNNCEEEDDPDSYSGGALTFYDLLPDPRLRLKGYPLQAEEGLLVAFSAWHKHEVQPVTRGERYSIVAWFF